MLVGLFGLAASILSFGFSRTFWGLIVRYITVFKVYLIHTDSTLEKVDAFAVF